MTIDNMLNDAVSIPNAINKYNEGKIRFHARACHHRGREANIMLRQVARNHGFIREVLETALDEWRKL